MINGTYKVSFEVDLKNMESKEEALEAIMEMLADQWAEDVLPDMTLELIALEEDNEEVEEDETDLLDELRVS